MKRPVIFYFAGIAALAVLIHVALVWATPRLITGRVIAKAGNGATNVFISPPLPTATWHSIVRPSPDLAYSICVLDLSRGPVHLSVPLTAPYTSVALYSTETDNYFVRDDREAGGKDLDVIVVPPGGGHVSAPAGVDVVEAPATSGIVLVRRVVESPDAFPALDAVRKKASCAPYKP
jgi:uncharacterized membrane protein